MIIPHLNGQMLQCALCDSRRRYLIEQGAQVGAVNSEGELPLDVATEDAMERLLKGEIKKQGRKTAMHPLHFIHMFQRL